MARVLDPVPFEFAVLAAPLEAAGVRVRWFDGPSECPSPYAVAWPTGKRFRKAQRAVLAAVGFEVFAYPFGDRAAYTVKSALFLEEDKDFLWLVVTRMRATNRYYSSADAALGRALTRYQDVPSMRDVWKKFVAGTITYDHYSYVQTKFWQAIPVADLHRFALWKWLADHEHRL